MSGTGVKQKSPTMPSSTGERSANPVLRGPILLAMHGGEESTQAITAAHLLAARLGVELRVVTVVELVREYSGMEVLPHAPEPDESVGGFEQGEKVRGRLREALGDQARWALDVRFGKPAQEIAHAAHEANATIIVVDAAPRRGVRHVVSGVRALQVVSRSPCPVLSVPSSFASLPATILAPVDFSPSSLRAAQAALLFANGNTRLFLVHSPLPLHFRHVVRDAAGSLIGGDPSLHLAHAREQLEPLAPPGATIETLLLEGGVVSSVLSLAERERADLIAVGTHGHGPLERFFVGSIAAGLLHTASCPVLVSPPPGPAEFLRLEL